MRNVKIYHHLYSTGETVFWMESADGLVIPLIPVPRATRVFKPMLLWEDQLRLAEERLARLLLREKCVRVEEHFLMGTVSDFPPALFLEAETKKLWQTMFYNLEEEQLLAVRNRALRYLNDGAMLPILA